jgi:predicted dehydrogenase
LTQTLAFGVMGTGNIASQFAGGVRDARRSRIVAAASRQQATADAFAARFALPAAYGDYQRLLDDPAVQAVYIALPNHLHHEWTIRALQAGKHVLCEKPLACTAGQAGEMVDAARRSGRKLVEAFMYRTHPLIPAVQQQIAAGAIGQVKAIRTSFCFRVRKVESNVRFRPEMAGGGLMDVGCYCIDFSRLMGRGDVQQATVLAQRHETGVDDLAVGVLRLSSGVLATFTCGMTVQADNTATICGDEGSIEIPVPWKPPVLGAEYALVRATPPRMDGMTQDGPVRQLFRVNADRPLYALEADAFAQHVLEGAAPAISEADSLANMRVLDQLRGQAGLGY